MEQYLNLLKEIKSKGTYKPAARSGMPGTQSLFGYQLRHDLSKGFPLLTTKKMFWTGIVCELLWFLRGDTNIKYLVDNSVNIWNQDAYQYYLKICKKNNIADGILLFEEFINKIKNDEAPTLLLKAKNYKLGDCGFQYGRVWRKWETQNQESIKTGKLYPSGEYEYDFRYKTIDQIKNVISSLSNNPESRRHLITAIDPAHDNDLALYWCHALFQFNCRPLTHEQRYNYYWTVIEPVADERPMSEKMLDEDNVPKYYLDCQLYQRSCDVVLGVPFNIASYALLTHIIAEICNMIPGEFIHTFGDVHIYDNHKEAVEEQLKRIPGKLPTINMPNLSLEAVGGLDVLLNNISDKDFRLENYNPQESIKAELSTGLIK